MCPSIGNCVFNAHFFRNFVSEDSEDYTITKGTNMLWEAYGFAARCTDEECATVDDSLYVVGDI